MAKKLVAEKDTVLWKDRRRRFGLPLSFTCYEICEERLTLRRGLFNTVTDEVLIYRIMDIQLVRKFGQKIFGVGSVLLVSTDKSHPTLELKNIKRSGEVRRFLSKLVESQRAARGISSREFLGSLNNDGGDF